jgi:AraC-like DNA-binding protein
MLLFEYNQSDITLSRNLDTQPDPAMFAMHTHSFAELYCFLAGKGVFHIEGSSYPLSPEDILIIRPNEAHYIEISPDVPYERICINFSTELFSALDPAGELTRPFLDRKPGKRNLYPGADCMPYLLNMLSSESNSRMAILANLILLLQKISQRFDQNQVPTSEPDSIEYRIIRYINQNLHRDLSVQELCDRYYISRAQLSRRFKKVTGTSVGKYIAAKRMIACRHQILQGQRPTDLYIHYGYRDYSTFYRAYIRYFGHSPKIESQCEVPERHNIM